jgi:hypothetical protein
MAKDEDIDRDVLDLIASETRRGRGKGPVDTERKRQDRQNAQNILKAMMAGDERRFSEMLRKAGIEDGDSRWTNAWKVFRAYSDRS